MIGKIKFYKPDVKWGFAITTDREEVFIHHTQIQDKSYVPKSEDLVEFDVEKSDRGLIAKKVRKI